MMQNDLRNSYDLSSLLWIVAVLLAVLFSAPAIAGGNMGRQTKSTKRIAGKAVQHTENQ